MTDFGIDVFSVSSLAITEKNDVCQFNVHVKSPRYTFTILPTYKGILPIVLVNQKYCLLPFSNMQKMNSLAKIKSYPVPAKHIKCDTDDKIRTYTDLLPFGLPLQHHIQ